MKNLTIIIGLAFFTSVSSFANDYFIKTYESRSTVSRYQDMTTINISGEAAKEMYEKAVKAKGIKNETRIDNVIHSTVMYQGFHCIKSEIDSKKVLRHDCSINLLDKEI
ncbi:hypothetical protein [Halobacteriovorax sp. DPLXC-1]|uniref:hypothetical protein n=1 Tax=Halobacteriovorax sp. DPLXC-1 TaxID=3110771 RepID=UPI002FF2FF3A